MMTKEELDNLPEDFVNGTMGDFYAYTGMLKMLTGFKPEMTIEQYKSLPEKTKLKMAKAVNKATRLIL